VTTSTNSAISHTPEQAKDHTQGKSWAGSRGVERNPTNSTSNDGVKLAGSRTSWLVAMMACLRLPGCQVHRGGGRRCSCWVAGRPTPRPRVRRRPYRRGSRPHHRWARSGILRRRASQARIDRNWGGGTLATWWEVREREWKGEDWSTELGSVSSHI
jgi:hypothetical protein